MTFEPITKAEMLYVQSKYKNAIVHVANKEHIKGKNRFLEINEISLKYLKEFRQMQNKNVSKKYGWFDEVDENGKKHTVFYK
jgi:hypothetical protein